jgi:hypothetical protein
MKKNMRPVQQPVLPPLPVGPSEVTAIHTGLLRLALAVEESRAYWERFDPSIPPPERSKLAFEQRWFGSKSLVRVRYLLGSFASRYEAFPTALSVLQRWTSMDLATRQALCHWHLQLSDPIYRKFTAELLVRRRGLGEPNVTRDAVLRWVMATFPQRWSEATCVQFASKLLSAALEAGLVTKRDPRSVPLPKVGDHALAYLLYVLRETRFEGSLTRNPYLGSVGLDEDVLVARAKALPGVTVRRMMGLWEFEWAYPDLASWAVEVVS